jgi:hypothetical protein
VKAALALSLDLKEVVVTSTRGCLFLIHEINVRGDVQRIDKDSNHIPCNYRPRQNQKSVIDPQYLEDTHDPRHPRVYSRSRPTPKHGEQVRDSGTRCAKACDKAKDLRPLKPRDEQALGVLGNQILAATQPD